MSGRLKLSDELDLPAAELAALRRRRDIRREKWRQFEESSPYAEYQPPNEWGLKLRAAQLFAALAASGGMNFDELALAIYGDRDDTGSKETSIRYLVASLRRSLVRFEIEIRVSRGLVRFIDLPRVFELARIAEPLPSVVVPDGPDSEDPPVLELTGRLGAAKAAESDDDVAYSVKEALRKLGISRTVFYERVNGGRITTRKIGNRTVVLKRDLLAYLEAERRAKFG